VWFVEQYLDAILPDLAQRRDGVFEFVLAKRVQ